MEILKKLRKDNKRTQVQMAQLLGISQQTYATYELDTRTPPIDILQKLADYFCVSVDYLLGREDTQPLHIPENLQDARVAFYGGVEGLNQEQIDNVSQFIEFIKNRDKK